MTITLKTQLMSARGHAILVKVTAPRATADGIFLVGVTMAPLLDEVHFPGETELAACVQGLQFAASHLEHLQATGLALQRPSIAPPEFWPRAIATDENSPA